MQREQSRLLQQIRLEQLLLLQHFVLTQRLQQSPAQQLEQPEYPTLASSKTGDKLENGCIVVHKFSDVRMALIAAPESTERFCRWSKEFSVVFDALE